MLSHGLYLIYAPNSSRVNAYDEVAQWFYVGEDTDRKSL